MTSTHRTRRSGFTISPVQTEMEAKLLCSSVVGLVCSVLFLVIVSPPTVCFVCLNRHSPLDVIVGR